MLNALKHRHKIFLHLSFIVSIVMIFTAVNVAHGKKRTVTVFSHGIMDRIPESGVLTGVTRLTDIKLNALRGEYEPFAFSLYCNNICKDVNLKISKLRNNRKKNDLILPEQIEIHRLKKSNASYRIKDWILEPMSIKDIKRGKMEHYWMTIHIPEDTYPGL